MEELTKKQKNPYCEYVLTPIKYLQQGLHMSEITQVKVSTNYDAFKFYSCNRAISPVHVNRLLVDSTFQIKYRLNPITVDKDMRIIDGQHRFTAIKMLGLPVYYIIDKDGNENDIKLRNSQQTQWDNNDFLYFHANYIEDYKILYDLAQKHKIRSSILFSALEKICGESNRGKLSRKFKEGSFRFLVNKEKFIEFIDLYIPEIKKCVIYRGIEKAKTYKSNVVVSGFAHHFITNRKIFDKALSKICTSSYIFPFCGNFEEGRFCVEKLANFKEKPIEI